MIWGLLLAVSSGIAFGIFLAPLRVIKAWRWENVWAVWSIVGMFLGPLAIAATTVPHYWQLNQFIGPPVVLVTLAAGALAGTSGFLYAVTVPAIGIGLATALNSGTCMALSLVPLFVLHRRSVLHAGGTLALMGVALSILGVALCGRGGSLREAETKVGTSDSSSEPTPTKRLPFATSVIFCCLAGAITSAFNFALAFPNPVINAAIRFGESDFAASTAFTALWLIGGAVSNLIYVIWQLRKNNTVRCFSAPGWLRCALWSVFLSLVFLLGMYSYTGSVSLMGTFGGVITWGVSMAAMILASALWDLSLGQWKGASARVMAQGVVVLVAAIVALSFAQYFFQVEGA